MTRLSLLLLASRSLRSEATLFGLFLLPRNKPLPFAWALASRLPPRSVGPSVRLASKASTRKRFVLCIDITFVISVP